MLLQQLLELHFNDFEHFHVLNHVALIQENYDCANPNL